jgi:hypothetical protein
VPKSPPHIIGIPLLGDKYTLELCSLALKQATELLMCSPADECSFSVHPSLIGDNKHEFLDEPDGIGF